MAATKTAKKTTARKTTAAKSTPKDANQEMIDAVEANKNAKSCAYPSCSERSTQEFGDNHVPSCDAHASIFETQSDDGAGIQQLVENYKG